MSLKSRWFTCPNCGTAFSNRGDPTPKYCSSKCAGLALRQPDPWCSVETCDRRAHGHQLCLMHLKRVSNHGSTTAIRNRRPANVSIEEWFMTLVKKTDSCWLWQGNILHTRGGYGSIWDPRCKKKIRAHHFLVGRPPKGMEWDHLCKTVHCVRPDHLELVTIHENRLRQWSRKHSSPLPLSVPTG